MLFFFSVETLATVGNGHMYPETFYGHLIAMLEIVIGMFGLAVITGLISFPAGLTIRHRIDEESPLLGMTPKDFRQLDMRIMASIVGVDSNATV
jgi:membrane-bound ClpP family serine protease